MLHLPTELRLAIMAHLPLSTLGSLQSVCREWKDLIDRQEHTIYHQAAVLHGLIPSYATSFEDLESLYSGRSLAEVRNWKDFCRRRKWINHSWSGKVSSVVTPREGPGRSVHRIKVDEQAGYILTTNFGQFAGGLQVTDIETDRSLWSLPEAYVRPYAHCEYDQGYLIFDYHNGAKEVWRRSDDYNETEAGMRVPESLPSLRQKNASDSASHFHRSSSTRGHFRPWGFLLPSEPTHAFRLSFPILAAPTWERVFLWDVRTGALVKTIEGIQQFINEIPKTVGDGPPTGLGPITYVDVGERHVFLCGNASLRVYSRDTGVCVLNVPSSRSPFGVWNVAISPQKPAETTPDSALVIHETLITRNTRPLAVNHDRFIAVHVSACGSHFAALLSSSKLLLVRDFERAARENLSIFDIAIQVQLGTPRLSGIYLAFEGGRAAVVTRSGVYVVKPEWSGPLPQPDTPPRVEVLRVPGLGNRYCLGGVTCLQMSDTGMFLNWDPDVYSLTDESMRGEEEETFYSTVSDEPDHIEMGTGGVMTMVDRHEAHYRLEASSVFSVDFI